MSDAEFFEPSGDPLDPENRPSGSPLDEFDSQEDVRRDIGEALGELDDLTRIEISDSEVQELRSFFNNFNITGADDADIEDINLLWHLLLRSTSLVKDFSYYLMTRKEALNHSTYPLAISWEELFHYAEKLKTPKQIRPYMISLTSQSMARIGFDPFLYADRALSESKHPKVKPESIRFLGWLSSMSFLSDLKEKKKEYVVEHRLTSFRIPDLATLVSSEVGRHVDILERSTFGYFSDVEMDIDALERSHQQIIIAMRGIYRMCGVMFLNHGENEG